MLSMLKYVSRLWRYRTVRWSLYVCSSMFLTLYAITLLNNFGFIDLEGLVVYLDSLNSPDGSTADFSATNPYRDLPEDQVILNSIKETLMFPARFMHDYFNDILLPTSLPGDDYELCSALLRNLETRTDLTWLALHESGIKQSVMAVAQRSDSPHSPVAEEPFDLQPRFKQLNKYWRELESQPYLPQRWEPTFDTQLLPPLLKAQPLVLNEANPDELITDQEQQDINSLNLILTPEQQLTAAREFEHYLATRAHKVSYLKAHPPPPMAFAPVAKQPLAVRTTWDKLLENGNIEPGESVSSNRLADEREWRPIYRSLLTEDVPSGWVQPGKEDAVAGLTANEWDVRLQQIEDRAQRREERGARVTAWQDEVRPARQAKEKEEFERMQKEWTSKRQKKQEL